MEETVERIVQQVEEGTPGCHLSVNAATRILALDDRGNAPPQGPRAEVRALAGAVVTSSSRLDPSRNEARTRVFVAPSRMPV